MTKREEFNEKFLRNMHLVVDFELAMQYYCDIAEAWESQMFAGSNITCRQYYTTLKQISEVEYSDAQCEAVKTKFIHEGVLDEYIRNLDTQYTNLKMLHDEIQARENKYLGML